MICLIPARKGSKRIAGKNLKPLAGRPLILWCLQNALDSGVFSDIYVSTDSAEVAETAVGWGGCKHIQRPAHLATDDSPDIEWVAHALGTIEYEDHKKGSICAPCSLGESHWIGREMCILRPTSPFLGPATLQRAKLQWDDLKNYASATVEPKKRKRYDSMRAIRRATETAWKQWRYDEETFEIDPITSVAAKKHLHSRPTNTLEDTWIQTAGFEMSWCDVPRETSTIAGDRIAGFVLEGPEALDLNTPEDWDLAEHYVARSLA